MQYAIEISAAGKYGDPRTLAGLARLAEDAGWDGVFVDDYIVYWDGGITYDPWLTLAAMTLHTKRVRLGTAITPLARRRPWKVAREALTLDHLSEGRFILGVGLGVGTSPDFAKLGEVTDNKQRAKQLDEALEVIVGLWSGQPFSYQGECFQVQDVTFLPIPVQKPRIPIWIGGGYPLRGPLQRAARWDGALLYKQTHGEPWLDMLPEDVAALKTYVNQQRSAQTPYDISIGGRERGEDWEQERDHIKRIAAAGATWWREAIPCGELYKMQEWIKRGPLRID